VKRWLATQLRRLLVWLGEDDHAIWRANAVRNLHNSRHNPGTGYHLVCAVEETLLRELPVWVTWRVNWDLKDEIVIRLNPVLTEADLEAMRRAKKGRGR
jgi:hypothetical protein